MKILIENRVELLKAKYPKLQTYIDYVVNLEFSKKTKNKYTDWVLAKAPKSVLLILPHIDKSMRYLEMFDKVASNLEKKDINQYDSLDELENTIEDYESAKGPEPEVERIYEDAQFLIVIPKNQEASCKYGANTKWCVTMRGTRHFENYTSGNQKLYFIINKKNSTDENYSKVAIHYDKGGTQAYWDSKDDRLSNKEIKIFKYAFPELIDVIETHYEKNFKEDKNHKMVYKIFTSKVSETKENPHFVVNIRGFELDDINTDGFYVSGFLDISYKKPNNVKIEIDSYDLLCTFHLTPNGILDCDILLEAIYNDVVYDFELFKNNISFSILLTSDFKENVDKIVNSIFYYVFNKIEQENIEDISKKIK